MSVLLQQILAGSAVLVSSIYLIKHYYDKHKVKTGCASCGLMKAASRPRQIRQNN